MTDEEIEVGLKLKAKVSELYRKHPEYRKYKKGLDRYEIFLEKMSEKYNINIRKVRTEIESSRGY